MAMVAATTTETSATFATRDHSRLIQNARFIKNSPQKQQLLLLFFFLFCLKHLNIKSTNYVWYTKWIIAQVSNNLCVSLCFIPSVTINSIQRISGVLNHCKFLPFPFNVRSLI